MENFDRKLVTVFGGSGFVGTQIVQQLAQKGHRVRVAVRRPDLALHVKTLGTVGQILPVQANVRNRASVERAIAGADMVISLIGIRNERGAQTFDSVHTEGAANIAQVAKATGVKALVHMSALGVDHAAEVSAYAASKLAGEAAVFKAFPEAVVLRPSIIFGKGDGFFNLMAALTRLFPVMPLIGANSRFQPAYVADVATAFVAAAEGKVKTGRIYELGGPQIETYRQLIERVQQQTQRNRFLLPLSSGIAKLLALPFALLPLPPLLTADQVELLGVDNVVSDAAIKDKRTFAAFGIVPVSMDTILPTYLYRYRKHGQFDRDNVPVGDSNAS